MGKYKDCYISDPQWSHGTKIEQLKQLLRVVWDGDLISKTMRDDLVKTGLAQKTNYGYNLITEKGLVYLQDLGIIHP